MIELLVASACTVMVVGGAVAMTVQVQNGYRRQSEDAVGEQEARYALEFIGRYIRGAGFNPFNVMSSNCPARPPHFVGVVIDPNLDGVNNDVTLQMDSNPPDGLIGGPLGACTQANEHVTIALDAVTDTIVFQDMAVGVAATTRTDSVIENLLIRVQGWQSSSDRPFCANVRYIETHDHDPYPYHQREYRFTQYSDTIVRSQSERPIMNAHVIHPQSERGVALIIVLLMLAVLSGLATGFSMNGQTEAAMAANEVYYAGARAAAEAGLQRATETIAKNTLVRPGPTVPLPQSRNAISSRVLTSCGRRTRPTPSMPITAASRFCSARPAVHDRRRQPVQLHHRHPR